MRRSSPTGLLLRAAGDEAAAAFLIPENIVESRAWQMGTLCLDFATYVKQDPFAPWGLVFSYLTAASLSAGKSSGRTIRALKGLALFIVPE